MSDQDKKDFLLVFTIAVLGYFMTRKKGKEIEVTGDFLSEAYRDLVISTEMYNVNGVPLYLWLPRNTMDYKATAAQYARDYKSDLTTDLFLRLSNSMFSQFTYELEQKGQSI